jgi:hypothetical protein
VEGRNGSRSNCVSYCASVAVSAHPSICPRITSRELWKNFDEIWYWCLKFVEVFQLQLHLDKNNRHSAILRTSLSKYSSEQNFLHTEVLWEINVIKYETFYAVLHLCDPRFKIKPTAFYPQSILGCLFQSSKYTVIISLNRICDAMDNIQTDLTETRYKGVDKIHLAQHRDKWRALLKMAITFPISWNTGDLLATSDTVTSAGFSLM